MAKKTFTYYGKTEEELKGMSVKEFAVLTNSRIRRTLLRGFTETQKILLKKISADKKNVKTHCRDMVIIPEMIGTTIKVYSGKEFIPVDVNVEMLGHVLGEFVMTRKKVSHSAPGIGATRSSSSASVR
ncbi:30S ribosomal protein S19 [Candidatus Woesearchaeota archaeon]|nr:30S ribosomal protein S19 [Candidatus Woesearchaeota archaeon]